MIGTMQIQLRALCTTPTPGWDTVSERHAIGLRFFFGSPRRGIHPAHPRIVASADRRIGASADRRIGAPGASHTAPAPPLAEVRATRRETKLPWAGGHCDRHEADSVARIVYDAHPGVGPCVGGARHWVAFLRDSLALLGPARMAARIRGTRYGI